MTGNGRLDGVAVVPKGHHFPSEGLHVIVLVVAE